MWIGLTGTPGTGKTTTAAWLRAHGHHTVNLTAYARQAGCLCGDDPHRRTKLVDTTCVAKAIRHDFNPADTIIFDGHFAHLLPLPSIIILRCHPTALRQRLKKKRYTTAKINENVEAEALDIILCEAVELHPARHCFEIDTTTLSPQDVGAIIQTLIDTNFPKDTNYKIGSIDWSEEILKE